MSRRPNDAYYSPENALGLLTRRVYIQGSVFEPCVGTGVIYEAFKRYGQAQSVMTNDIVLGLGHYNFDASKPWPIQEQYDWIITNPPFNQALPILRQSLLHARLGVAFLLRLSFLEPGRQPGTVAYERGQFLAVNPPTKLIVLPRYSFTGDGKTDSVTCAWMVWGCSLVSTTPEISIAAPAPRNYYESKG